jgi:hypothetical protein
MPFVRVLLAAAVTFAVLAAATSAGAATPPRDCLAAWNHGATPAQRDDVQRAKRVQLTRGDWGNPCAVLYVLRSGTTKLMYGTQVAGPDGPTGLWAAAHAIHSLGPPIRCTPNVRVLRGGTLVPL